MSYLVQLAWSFAWVCIFLKSQFISCAQELICIPCKTYRKAVGRAELNYCHHK